MSSSTSSRVDLDDSTGDDVAVVELDDRGVDRVVERHAAEVVDDDLGLVDLGFDLAFRRQPRSLTSGAASAAASGVDSVVVGSGASVPSGTVEVAAVVSVCWSNTSFLIVGTVGGRAGSPSPAIELVRVSRRARQRAASAKQRVKGTEPARTAERSRSIHAASGRGARAAGARGDRSTAAPRRSGPGVTPCTRVDDEPAPRARAASARGA